MSATTPITDTMSANAIAGYSDIIGDEDGGNVPTSPAWYAYRAGKAMRENDEPPPIRATMSRGYSVNVWTQENRYLVMFQKIGESGNGHIVRKQPV